MSAGPKLCARCGRDHSLAALPLTVLEAQTALLDEALAVADLYASERGWSAPLTLRLRRLGSAAAALRHLDPPQNPQNQPRKRP